ncbi:phosphopantothenoylcysteine decarboxylase isoform 3-T4 [Amazona ochrocephala]
MCVLVSSVPWKQQCFPWEELHIQLAYLCQCAVFGSTAQVLPGHLSVADKARGHPSAPLSPPNRLATCTHCVPACLAAAIGLFAGWDLSSLKSPLSFLPVRAELCWNVTCVIRAWDLSKPLLFCPAMNTAMWEHPITAQHVEQLKGFGYTEIPCVVKKLVCGDEGRGAMAEVWTIVECVKRILEERGLPAQS